MLCRDTGRADTTHPAMRRSPWLLYRWLCLPCRANSGAGEPGSGAALAARCSIPAAQLAMGIAQAHSTMAAG